MSTAKYGVKSREWAKHLRPDGKQEFWNRLRTFYAKKIPQEIKELYLLQALQDEWEQEV